MSDGMVLAVIVTNLLLGAMTVGLVVACVVGGCRSAYRDSHRTETRKGQAATA